MAQPNDETGGSATGPPPPGPPVDPVLARRRLLARLADLGQRLGYSLFGLAMVLFVIALVTELPRAVVTAIVVCMTVGSVVLAPAIVVGYGVRAADREDRERCETAAKSQRNVSP